MKIQPQWVVTPGKQRNNILSNAYKLIQVIRNNRFTRQRNVASVLLLSIQTNASAWPFPASTVIKLSNNAVLRQWMPLRQVENPSRTTPSDSMAVLTKQCLVNAV
jgi:hypothetical protein